MAKVRKHITIRGRVQGVWFRASTRDNALAHSVNGWVKNTFAGHVEAVFEGEEQDVKAVIAWCHTGPSAAVVKEVKVADEPFRGEFSTFSVKGW